MFKAGDVEKLKGFVFKEIKKQEYNLRCQGPETPKEKKYNLLCAVSVSYHEKQVTWKSQMALRKLKVANTKVPEH